MAGAGGAPGCGGGVQGPWVRGWRWGVRCRCVRCERMQGCGCRGGAGVVGGAGGGAPGCGEPGVRGQGAVGARSAGAGAPAGCRAPVGSAAGMPGYPCRPLLPRGPWDVFAKLNGDLLPSAGRTPLAWAPWRAGLRIPAWTAQVGAGSGTRDGTFRTDPAVGGRAGPGNRRGAAPEPGARPGLPGSSSGGVLGGR